MVVEFVWNGKTVSAGKEGKLVCTSLHSYAMPFIRYDTQDVITLTERKCYCGRELTAIKQIDGRDSDILITPMGKKLIVHNFTGYFEWLESIEQFQIQQNKVDEFIICLKVNSKYNLTIQNEIYEYWKNYIDENVEIKIEIVENIPVTNSGKKRFLIRNKEIELD